MNFNTWKQKLDLLKTVWMILGLMWRLLQRPYLYFLIFIVPFILIVLADAAPILAGECVSAIGICTLGVDL